METPKIKIKKPEISFSRFKKRVIIVGSDGISLFAPTPDGIEHEVTLSWEAPEFEPQLTSVLASSHKTNPVLMLFDGVDQTYRKEENIPKMSSMDRQKYVKRKLNQAFPSFPVKAILEIPAPKMPDGTKGPLSYLFAAVPETDRIDKVSSAILEAGVPVALQGFGLLPAESSNLVTTLADVLFPGKENRSRWVALIGQHETGGLRQIVVRDGMLALTRSTSVSDAGTQGEGWTEDVLREFKATMTYIARFGFTVDQGLDIIMICGDADKPIFAQKDFSANNVSCLNVTEALQALGFKGKALGENNFACALHAAWASKKKFLYLPIQVPSLFRIMVPRLSVRISSILFIISFLILAGISLSVFQDYSNAVEKTEEAENKKNLLQKEFDQESKIFDALPVKPDIIRGTLAVKKLLDLNNYSLTPTLNVLNKALDVDIKLNNISFEHSSVLSGQPTGAPAGGIVAAAAAAISNKGAKDSEHGTTKIKFDFVLTKPPPPPPPPPAGDKSSPPTELELKVARSERFVATLKHAFPGYDVKLTSQFGSVDRAGKFEGSASKEVGAKGNLVSTVAPSDFATIEMSGPPLEFKPQEEVPAGGKAPGGKSP